MPLSVPQTMAAVTKQPGNQRVLFDMVGVSAQSWGGMQEHVLTLGSELKELGWTPLLLVHTQYADVYEQQLAREGIRVLRVPALQVNNGRWQPLPLYIRALRQTLILEHIAIYHIHSALMGHEVHSLIASYAARVPTIITYHCTPWNESRRRRLGMIVAHRVFRPNTIAVSRAVAEMAWHNYRVPEHDTAIILNGIHDFSVGDATIPVAEESVSGRRTEDVVIGVAARLERVKGIDVLLEALALLDSDLPFRVVIAGEGPEQRALEAQSKRLRLSDKVDFIGFRPNVRDLMREWDLVVVPSRSQEGLPLTAIEALAARLPLIATRVGGLPELVHDGKNGRVVPSEDPQMLAKALAATIQDPASRLRFGSASREMYLSELRADAMTRKTVAVYHQRLGIQPDTAEMTRS